MVLYTVEVNTLTHVGFIPKQLCPTKVEWRLGSLVFIQDLKNKAHLCTSTVSITDCEKTEDNLDTHRIPFRREDVHMPIGRRLTSSDLHF